MKVYYPSETYLEGHFHAAGTTISRFAGKFLNYNYSI